MSDNFATFKHVLRFSIEYAVWLAVLFDFANLDPTIPSCVHAAYHHVTVVVSMYYVAFLHAVLIAEVGKLTFSTLVAQYLALFIQCVNFFSSISVISLLISDNCLILFLLIFHYTFFLYSGYIHYLLFYTQFLNSQINHISLY